MMGFGGFSTNKNLASKITIFQAMAPVSHLGHMKGALKILSGGTWIAKVKKNLFFFLQIRYGSNSAISPSLILRC